MSLSVVPGGNDPEVKAKVASPEGEYVATVYVAGEPYVGGTAWPSIRVPGKVVGFGVMTRLPPEGTFSAVRVIEAESRTTNVLTSRISTVKVTVCGP